MRIVAAAIALAGAGAATAAPGPIAGRWLSEGGQAVIEIGSCGAQTCGRIVRILKTDPTKPTTDVYNPDRALRNRPIVGLVFLTGFTPGEDRWRGRIYDPKSGRSYRSELMRDGRALKVKGCLGPFCRTQEWTEMR